MTPRHSSSPTEIQIPPKQTSKKLLNRPKNLQKTKNFSPKKFVDQSESSNLKSLKTPLETFDLSHTSHDRLGRISNTQNHSKITISFLWCNKHEHTRIFSCCIHVSRADRLLRKHSFRNLCILKHSFDLVYIFKQILE